MSEEQKTIPEQIEALRALVSESFAALNARIDSLTQTPQHPPSVPVRTDGLFRFQRPAVRAIDPWVGREMASADADEAFARALHGVNWRGGYLADVAYEEAWDEIERLKAGDQTLIVHYRALDPEFAGYALLTGLIQPVKYDARSFGVNAANRDAWAGTTISTFIEAQFIVLGGGGGPSGDEV